MDTWLIVITLVLATVYLVGPLSRRHRWMNWVLLMFAGVLVACIGWLLSENDANKWPLIIPAVALLWSSLWGIGVRILVLAGEKRGRASTVSVWGQIIIGLFISLFPVLSII